MLLIGTLQFSAAQPFTSTETGADSYTNAAGTYRVRFKPITGSALAAQHALSQNSGKSACWNLQFNNPAGAATQPSVSYWR